ncbi:MAG: Rieske 2Fe-2S domain-containing protein [Solirubrobacteraceae bacterium]
MRLWQWFTAFFLGRWLRRRQAGEETERSPDAERPPESERIVPAGSPNRRAENIVLFLLGLAVLFGLGFIVVYAAFSATRMPNELLGLCLALCLLCIGGALAVFSKHLIVSEEIEDDYPEEHPDDQEQIVETVRESGSRITRKKLLLGAGAAAGGTLGLAALTPALSLGPVWDTAPLDQTPWKPGVRLVDETGAPMLAADVQEQSFYTAFPEGADPELIGSPLVVIRLDPAKLELPANRAGWAPQGILAFSKICTHAGCAVALYRKPTFPVVEPHAALVCPCHYSTFDPFTGGTVTYGPAGRPLPQLPLMIDGTGYLRAAGNFSARPGPSWWNVREKPTNE